ncbi:hypothetical protein OAQ99_00285 [Candidatus Kapabacteria bacterium]|nr:hypothetical protein [Candidatus Kapabacteria bacterium]
MKNILQILALVAITFSFSLNTAFSEEEKEEKKEKKGFFGRMKENMDKGLKKLEGTDEENLKYYREKFEQTYTDFFFDEVWNACIESLDEYGCAVAQKSSRQDENALFKGKLVSEYCIFAMMEKDEDVADSLWKYSYKVPVIRGADWGNGRMQYKIILKEQEDESVYMLIRGEISGREDQITNEVHFWKSNGRFEHFLLETINEKLASL